MKKFTTVVIAVIMCFACVLGLAACKDDPPADQKSKTAAIDGEYAVYTAMMQAGEVVNLRRSGSGYISINNGNMEVRGQLIGVELEENGFSYRVANFNDGERKVVFEKVADGEYFCRTNFEYLCIKGKTPTVYPVEERD